MNDIIKTCLKTCLLACAGLGASMGCIAEIEGEDAEFRFGAQPVGGACDEEYYYVVEGENLRQAQGNCDDTCSGVVCEDGEPVTACASDIPGDAPAWNCDCKCGCDDPSTACDLSGIGVDPL